MRNTMIDPFELLPTSFEHTAPRRPAVTIDLEVDWQEDAPMAPGVSCEAWQRSLFWSTDDSEGTTGLGLAAGGKGKTRRNEDAKGDFGFGESPNPQIFSDSSCLRVFV